MILLCPVILGAVIALALVGVVKGADSLLNETYRRVRVTKRTVNVHLVPTQPGEKDGTK